MRHAHHYKVRACEGMAENQSGCLGWLALFVIACLFLYYTLSSNPSAPQSVDATGYVSHKVESTITADAGWIVGESRTCISNPFDITSAKELQKPVGYALWGLQCGGGDWHRITITFWGSQVQTGTKAAYWNCTRTSESFTCKQTAAY
jgi:hypothetical protein